MAEVLELNIGDLSLDELCDFEEHADQTAMDVLLGQVSPSAKSLSALVWILKRKNEPTYTYAEARKLKLDQFEIKRP